MMSNELNTSVEELEGRIHAGDNPVLIQQQAQELLHRFVTAEATDERVKELRCRLHICLSIAILQQGGANNALAHLESALQDAELLHNKALKARAVGYLGIVHEKLSNYPLATEYLHTALALDSEFHHNDRVAVWASNLGIVYAAISDYTKALEYFTQALAIDEEYNNRRKVINTTSNIGLVYYQLGNSEKALEYLQKALEYETIANNLIGIARHSGSIGSVYTAVGDYPKALEYFESSLRIYEEQENKAGLSITAGNVGNVYHQLRQYAQALAYYQKALEIDREMNNQNGIARHTGNIGWVYAQEGYEHCDSSLAEEYYHSALTMLQELGLKKEQSDMCKRFADLYESQERWKEFAKYYKQYHVLEKEVLSEEAIKRAEQFGYERQIAEREKQLAVERSRSMEREHILNNILPEDITTRLIQGENPIADHFDSVSILFMDIVGFTQLSSRISAQQLVYLLNTIFTRADAIMRECGLEKIKTIGDAYMAVAGAPRVREDHAICCANAALQLLDIMNRVDLTFLEMGEATTIQEPIPTIQVRIGLHSGPVAAGVVGENKFLYDLWGDTVNTASRMESHGETGRIHLSEEFAKQLTGMNGQLSMDSGQFNIEHSSLTIAN